jgi:hypothetical protein
VLLPFEIASDPATALRIKLGYVDDFHPWLP